MNPTNDTLFKSVFKDLQGEDGAQPKKKNVTTARMMKHLDIQKLKNNRKIPSLKEQVRNKIEKGFKDENNTIALEHWGI